MTKRNYRQRRVTHQDPEFRQAVERIDRAVTISDERDARLKAEASEREELRSRRDIRPLAALMAAMAIAAFVGQSTRKTEHEHAAQSQPYQQLIEDIHDKEIDKAPIVNPPAEQGIGTPYVASKPPK